MEETFDAQDGDWEITRYAGAPHGFTVFDSASYQTFADDRSWTSMLTSFQELLKVPTMEGDEPAGGDTDSGTPGSTDDGGDDDETSSGYSFVTLVVAGLGSLGVMLSL